MKKSTKKVHISGRRKISNKKRHFEIKGEDGRRKEGECVRQDNCKAREEIFFFPFST